MAQSAMLYLLMTALYLVFSMSPTAAAEEKDTARMEQFRARMVTTLVERYGMTDDKVLRAMRKVPRHLFVPAPQREKAYNDGPLPIGYGQTISQPFIVAYMTHIVGIDENSRVLEIGSGSGYQAAILAEIADRVYTIEIIPELARWTEERLHRTGYETVQTKLADGYHGWPEEAPFDAIIVTAASPQIPPPLMDQLKDGGRIVIPVGSPYLTQQLVLVEKNGDDLRTRNLMPVRFVPFTRAVRP